MDVLQEIPPTVGIRLERIGQPFESSTIMRRSQPVAFLGTSALLYSPLAVSHIRGSQRLRQFLTRMLSRIDRLMNQRRAEYYSESRPQKDCRHLSVGLRRELAGYVGFAESAAWRFGGIRFER